MDPQRQFWVSCPIPLSPSHAPGIGIAHRPRHPAVQVGQPPDFRSRFGQVAVDDPEVAAERALEPVPRVLAERRVSVHALRDERMGELEQESPRTGRKQDGRFAVQTPGLAAWAVQAETVVSLGSRERLLCQRRGWSSPVCLRTRVEDTRQAGRPSLGPPRGCGVSREHEGPQPRGGRAGPGLDPGSPHALWGSPQIPSRDAYG